MKRHVGVGVHEDLHIHQVAEGLVFEDQDALHDDHPRRMHQHRFRHAVVVGEGILRAVDGLAPAQLLQLLHHQGGVKGVGMVVVELTALLEGHLRMFLVVVVVGKDDHILGVEGFPQLEGEGGLARAGTSGYTDNGGGHLGHLLVSSLAAAAAVSSIIPARTRFVYEI